MRRHLALFGLLLAVLTVPAFAQDADPLAKIFAELKARWSAVDKADAKSAGACEAGHAPRMSFQPATVFADWAAAAATGMPDSTSPPSPGGMRWRSGDHVLEAEQQDIVFTGKPAHASWLLTLRDADTGASLAARTVPEACAPTAITPAPDGGFLMLSGELVLALDDSDLHVKAVYRLNAPANIMPTGITLLPGNRLLASTATSPVLLYNLSDPIPQ